MCEEVRRQEDAAAKGSYHETKRPLPLSHVNGSHFAVLAISKWSSADATKLGGFSVVSIALFEKGSSLHITSHTQRPSRVVKSAPRRRRPCVISCPHSQTKTKTKTD